MVAVVVAVVVVVVVVAGRREGVFTDAASRFHPPPSFYCPLLWVCCWRFYCMFQPAQPGHQSTAPVQLRVGSNNRRRGEGKRSSEE